MRKKIKQFCRSTLMPLKRAMAFRRLKKFHAKQRSLDEIVDLALRFPSRGFFRIDSIQKRSEILAMANTVATLKPRNVLEIGTARGGTLFIWSQLASQKVVSCDIMPAGPKNSFYESFPPPESSCEVMHLSGDSHDKAFRKRVFDCFQGEKVDFLFIDGDHTEKGVEQDYNDYHELVRPGGIIAFHDIIESQPLTTNQVYYFWKRIKDGKNTEEYIDKPNQIGFGIGIIRV